MHVKPVHHASQESGPEGSLASSTKGNWGRGTEEGLHLVPALPPGEVQLTQTVAKKRQPKGKVISFAHCRTEGIFKQLLSYPPHPRASPDTLK